MDDGDALQPLQGISRPPRRRVSRTLGYPPGDRAPRDTYLDRRTLAPQTQLYLPNHTTPQRDPPRLPLHTAHRDGQSHQSAEVAPRTRADAGGRNTRLPTPRIYPTRRLHPTQRSTSYRSTDIRYIGNPTTQPAPCRANSPIFPQHLHRSPTTQGIAPTTLRDKRCKVIPAKQPIEESLCSTPTYHTGSLYISILSHCPRSFFQSIYYMGALYLPTFSFYYDLILDPIYHTGVLCLHSIPLCRHSSIPLYTAQVHSIPSPTHLFTTATSKVPIRGRSPYGVLIHTLRHSH